MESTTDTMATTGDRKLTNVFERYLTLWVALCIVVGILLGIAPCTAMVLV